MAEEKQPIPPSVYRQLAEEMRRGIQAFDSAIRTHVDTYDQAVLSGDDEERDRQATNLVLFGTIAYLGLGANMDKARTILDTVKMMQEGV